MGILDGVLGQLGGAAVPDIATLAGKVGLDPSQVESAIGALAQAHGQSGGDIGDTTQTAAASTGLPVDILEQIVGHLGGAGSLGQVASLLSNPAVEGVLGQVLGQGGSGNLLGELGGLASGLLNQKS